MACIARVAVVFRETLNSVENRICSIEEFPCIVKRYFFGNVKIQGDQVVFVVKKFPADWDGFLYPVNGIRILFLNEFWFDSEFGTENELEEFAGAVEAEKDIWWTIAFRGSKYPVRLTLNRRQSVPSRTLRVRYTWGGTGEPGQHLYGSIETKASRYGAPETGARGYRTSHEWAGSILRRSDG